MTSDKRESFARKRLKRIDVRVLCKPASLSLSTHAVVAMPREARSVENTSHPLGALGWHAVSRDELTLMDGVIMSRGRKYFAPSSTKKPLQSCGCHCDQWTLLALFKPRSARSLYPLYRQLIRQKCQSTETLSAIIMLFNCFIKTREGCRICLFQSLQCLSA